MNVQGLKQPWSEAEVALLREVWPKGVEVARAAFPHRTAKSIGMKAHALRLVSGHLWNAKTNAQLTLLWDPVVGDLRKIAQMMGRSPIAVYHHAVKVLKLGVVPQGYAVIYKAAAWAGIAPGTLDRLIATKKLKSYRPFSHPRYAGGRAHIVSLDDLEAVIQDYYVERMSIDKVAAKLGHSAPHLRTRLKKAGLQPPSDRRGTTWRVREEDVRRVLQADPIRPRRRRK